MSDDAQSGTEADDEAVVRYLAALETRRTAPETLAQPDDAAAGLAAFEPPEAERPELEAELGKDTPGSRANVDDLEAGFVVGAADYGRRHDIRWSGWRNAGVPEEVLERAGISPDDG
jgi:hypothetical protein